MAHRHLLRRIQRGNWLFLALLSSVGWLTLSAEAALAAFLGGLLAAVSFSLLKRDLSRLLNGPLQAVKPRFFIRYYLRFTGLVAILYWLVTYHQIHIPGLLMGLSTVLLSIVAAMAGEAKRFYFTAKEAA